MFLGDKTSSQKKILLVLMAGILLALIGGALCGPGHDIHLAATGLAVTWHFQNQVQDYSPCHDLASSLPFSVFEIDPPRFSDWAEQAQNSIQALAGVLRLSLSRAPPA